MAKLSYGAKKNLPTKTFAVVKRTASGHTERKYPIPDLAHARNANARVAQFGTPAEKAAVHHAVAAKFPELAKRSEAIKGEHKHNSPHNPPG